jgi:GTPase
MKNLVAILGRPNVGKSTLFNRLIGARKAIVHDEPGVTRDRHYGTAEWTGTAFTLIDTGGYVPNSSEVFEKAIREQVEIAIEEAQVLLFVVDVESGLTPLDDELGRMLRKSNKSVLLVVNKVDSEKRESEVGQFHRLGLGEPFSLSALAGRKIGDFLDILVAKLPNAQSGEPDTRLKIAVIGKPNVGKSSLANALLGESRSIVTDIPGTTRDSIDSILKYQKEEILLIDTAGLRRKSKVHESVEFYSTVRALKAINRSDVTVLVIDATTGVDKQDLRILTRIAEERRGTILAVNKWDLIEKDDKTAIAYEKELRTAMRIYDYVPVMFISALTKQRIYKLLDLAKKVNEESRKRISTAALNAAILPQVMDKPHASRQGKEIKINYITQVKTTPPMFAFFTNEPKLIEDRYRRFLERLLREKFGFVGVPILLTFKKKNR